MAVKLKRYLGEGGAGLDASHGQDTLHELLEAVITTQNALVASLNQFITDYNATTSPTTASSVTAGAEVE